MRTVKWAEASGGVCVWAWSRGREGRKGVVCCRLRWIGECGDALLLWAMSCYNPRLLDYGEHVCCSISLTIQKYNS